MKRRITASVFLSGYDFSELIEGLNEERLRSGKPELTDREIKEQVWSDLESTVREDGFDSEAVTVNFEYIEDQNATPTSVFAGFVDSSGDTHYVSVWDLAQYGAPVDPDTEEEMSSDGLMYTKNSKGEYIKLLR